MPSSTWSRPVVLSALALLGLRVVLGAADEPAGGARPAPAAPAARQAPGGKGKPKVLREILPGGVRHPGERRLRITGKVTVDDANTLHFEDGTRVVTSGGIDAPDLEQRALRGGKLYACGQDAADFLEKLIGGRPVSFYAFGAGTD